jgi:N-acyl-D-amino-acid deacylase
MFSEKRSPHQEKPGNHTDLVVFDPEKIEDRAAFTDPHRYPDDMRFVIVNGRATVENTRHTGELAGQVLRRGA